MRPSRHCFALAVVAEFATRIRRIQRSNARASFGAEHAREVIEFHRDRLEASLAAPKFSQQAAADQRAVHFPLMHPEQTRQPICRMG
jgi:hypothetical protein